MRVHWQLPEEEKFRYTGPDWLLVLLDQCSATERDLLNLLLWKTWNTHNNITHQTGPMSIPEAVHSLCAMQATLSDIAIGEGPERDSKGKQACSSSGKRKKDSKGSKGLGPTAWEPPPGGWAKINVDASFVPQTGEAGIGIIARDSERRLLFTAWRVLFSCQSASEASRGMFRRTSPCWPVGAGTDYRRNGLLKDSPSYGSCVRSLCPQLSLRGGQVSGVAAAGLAGRQGKKRV